MSTELVRVPYGENAGDKAVLLLEAAQHQGLEASVVRIDTGGTEFSYIVPKEVADAALDGDDADGVEEYLDPFDNPPEVPEATDMSPQHEAEKELSDRVAPPVKKAAAKRAPAKKTAAKKTAAKKTAAKKTAKKA
jgi:hypothetical protein